ncbi:MAG: hypothetical protein IJS59_00230 [Bacteroidaceae bacterium]|nr:hypothetical protein [Bacteroidaceae bacterium]
MDNKQNSIPAARMVQYANVWRWQTNIDDYMLGPMHPTPQHCLAEAQTDFHHDSYRHVCVATVTFTDDTLGTDAAAQATTPDVP